eukprot:m.246462 g.246462  ORF g.246462 m.246462 type:complete len:105 (-) comp15044_c0_seq1:40-354(-)
MACLASDASFSAMVDLPALLPGYQLVVHTIDAHEPAGGCKYALATTCGVMAMDMRRRHGRSEARQLLMGQQAHHASQVGSFTVPSWTGRHCGPKQHAFLIGGAA